VTPETYAIVGAVVFALTLTVCAYGETSRADRRKRFIDHMKSATVGAVLPALVAGAIWPATVVVTLVAIVIKMGARVH
jgi:hypothetical protein